MIKLNNKNITYVALADSNNSLKAPKEIWYADSSHSVKLVYRRKDALIEGVDYEKFHWLTGDRSAYIDTNIIYLDGVVDLIAMVEGEIGKLGRERLNNSSDYYSRFVISINPSNGLATVFSSNQADAYITQPLVLQIDVQNDSLTLNGTVKSLDFIPNTEANSIYLFAVNRFNNPNISSQSIIKISKFSISSKINLVPCKLLKPVPKWLDANGIRRQVGECGMIDLVSGKFYGNVNSVGTFTVENYYERKEWLIGDGTAYIEGIDYNLWTNRVELEVGKINVTTIQNNELHYKSTDSNNVWAVQQNPTITPQFICIFRESGVNKHIVRIDLMPSQVTLSFYQNGGYAYCLYNDTEIKGGTLNQSSWDTNITPDIFSYKMSYIREVLPNGSYRSNLIPCTLTMDLPASMDANGIARTKGTSGMWDLVSDKFYGNVANSGTFKAVNLAEGVDYEVHQWLRTEVNTKATLMTLDINSYSFSFSRKPLSGSNVPYFTTEGDTYLYSDSDNTIRIWNSSQYGYYYSNTPFNWGDTISITSSSNSLVVNSQLIPQNTFPCKYVYFGANNTKGAEHYTSSIIVDGIERYIPVKLLKSIPSEYDANGIARQAGECGMYDTVSGKFFGNMARSGSFTVSDDN